MKAFIDTNILLDVLGRREPHYEDAAQIWTLAETGKLEAYVSAISFTNVFYIVRKFRDIRAAKQAVKWMRDVFHIAACDDKILHQAIDANWRDLEDAVQYFSAWRVGASCIVSRNVGDYAKSEMDVLSPEEFLAILYIVQEGMYSLGDTLSEDELNRLVATLTPLQQKIVQGLRDGQSVSQIASMTGRTCRSIHHNIHAIREEFANRGTDKGAT